MCYAGPAMCLMGVKAVESGTLLMDLVLIILLAAVLLTIAFAYGRE